MCSWLCVRVSCVQCDWLVVDVGRIPTYAFEWLGCTTCVCACVRGMCVWRVCLERRNASECTCAGSAMSHVVVLRSISVSPPHSSHRLRYLSKGPFTPGGHTAHGGTAGHTAGGHTRGPYDSTGPFTPGGHTSMGGTAGHTAGGHTRGPYLSTGPFTPGGHTSMGGTAGHTAGGHTRGGTSGGTSGSRGSTGGGKDSFPGQ